MMGDPREHFKNGVKLSMQQMNSYYNIPTISADEIETYIASLKFGSGTESLNAINYQAWIHHLMNPAEGWANLRRSGYPYLEDRTKYDRYTSDFTYDDADLTTPCRLKYPALEAKYNKDNYNAAVQKLGGKDDWHKRVWWDVNAHHVK